MCACCAALPLPQLRQKLPRVVTFQRKSSNRRVINEGRLIAMLQTFGEVRSGQPPQAQPGAQSVHLEQQRHLSAPGPGHVAPWGIHVQVQVASVSGRPAHAMQLACGAPALPVQSGLAAWCSVTSQAAPWLGTCAHRAPGCCAGEGGRVLGRHAV